MFGSRAQPILSDGFPLEHSHRFNVTPTNPLLDESSRPLFHLIRGEHVEPGVREILRRGQERLEALAASSEPPTFENTLEVLGDLTRWVAERLVPVSHLLSVSETPELRAAYNEVLADISQFWTRVSLNEGLWRRLRGLEASEEGGTTPH